MSLHPFGMTMPGRNVTLSAGNGSTAGSSYRYGFNGQEKSDEIFEGSTTALFWEYDSRTGRRWNIDPVVKEYESPYLTFSGNPILLSDVDGDCASVPGMGKGNSMGSTEPIVQAEPKQEEPSLPYYRLKSSWYDWSSGTPGKNGGTRYTIAERPGLGSRNSKPPTYDLFASDADINGNFHYFVSDPKVVNLSDVSLPGGLTIQTKGTNWHYYGLIDGPNERKSTHMAASEAGVNGLGAGFYGLLAGGTMLYTAPAWLPSSSIFQATTAVRGASAGSDIVSQYVSNIGKNGFGWNNISNINLTSVALSWAMPSSNTYAGFGSSAFEFNLGNGYNGVGNGKSFTTVLQEGTINSVGNYIGNKTGDAMGKYLKWKPAQAEGVGNTIGNYFSSGFQTIVNAGQ